MPQKTKYIFISGGVMSALGKGVTSASIALLLKSRGFSVSPIKCENNLNVDFGTLNPIEHGDPFLCFDGLEADQDLGNYERFLNQNVGHDNFMTMGQLYLSVINRERNMGYDGEDVEPIPHIVNEIIDRIHQSARKSKADFCVIELGGTVGEYENNNGLYYEAARIMGMKEPVAHVHVTYVPVPPHVGEPKTKPAQFGLKQLMSMGITPNFIVVRSELPVDSQRKYKFAFKFNIEAKDVFSNENLDDIHRVPLHLHQQKLDDRILDYFSIKTKTKASLSKWQRMVKHRTAPKTQKATIAIVGKYFGTGDSQIADSYYALLEAIRQGADANNIDLDLKYINSQKQFDTIEQQLQSADGIIVPIGWGSRGVEGKIKAIRYSRENKVPYLGLCYGMQLAAVEFARHQVGLRGANSSEVDKKTKHPIIHDIPFDSKFQKIKGDGASMRLGDFDCVLKPGTLAHQIYSKHNQFKDKSKHLISERHRHRYEFNNAYRKQLEDKGFVISGTSPDDFFVEMIELPKETHPFFLATQAHPEYKSKPLAPHSIFIEFLKAASPQKSAK